MNVHAAPESVNADQLLGGIEAGGTKYVCAVAFEPEHPILEARFPTATPEETVARAVAFFREAEKIHSPLSSLGIGTFGPARIDPEAGDYGTILSTPKEGWAGFPLVESLRQTLGMALPIAFDTDVNAAALGEAMYGAARGVGNIAYVTVGTGIGGGLIQRGRLLHGRLHPEIGHFLVPDLDAEYGKSTQVCPFHTSCLEGRASGPAIAARWGCPAELLPPDHPAWELEARYLALGCLQITAAWSPDVILLGGGVSQGKGLIERVRDELLLLTGGYWDLPRMDEYLRYPALNQQAGIIGALELARKIGNAKVSGSQ